MIIRHFLFYLLAITALLSAVGVISTRSPVRSALFLVLTFFMVAGMWLLSQAEFLALILVVVYVGAVMTLFLFVIMMINVDNSQLPKRSTRVNILGGLLSLLLMGMMLKTIEPAHVDLPSLAHSELKPASHSNTTELGKILYTQFGLATEMAALLLLVGIIGAISLTHRPPRQCKTQQPEAQIRVRPEDRIRMVSLQSEQD